MMNQGRSLRDRGQVSRRSQSRWQQAVGPRQAAPGKARLQGPRLQAVEGPGWGEQAELRAPDSTRVLSLPSRVTV